VNLPLVSVGMPVLNGGLMFQHALKSILEQDYDNLEIIISDNASSDGTKEFCKRMMKLDSRIRYIRQTTTISAFSNLNFVLDLAQGEFFMWAAHDDLRSNNFVSENLNALILDKGAILSFGKLRISTSHGSEGVPVKYDFKNGHLGNITRLRKQALMQCFHIYGLWRTKELRLIPKIHCPWWFDLPLMMAASLIGNFVEAPMSTFISLDVPKSDEERSKYQDGTKTKSKIENIAKLLNNTFHVLRRTTSIKLTLLSLVFVTEKNVRFSFISLRRKFKYLFLLSK